MNTNSIQPRRALDYTPPSEPGTWWRKATVSLAAATIGLAGLGVSTASADDSAPVTASHSTSADRGSDSGEGSQKSSSDKGSGDTGSADHGKGDSTSGSDNSGGTDSGGGSGQESNGGDASDGTSAGSDSTGSDSTGSDSTGSDSTGSDEQAGDGGSGDSDSNTSNTPSEDPTPAPSTAPTPAPSQTPTAKPTEQAKPEAVKPSKSSTGSKSSKDDDESTSRKSTTRHHSASRHYSSSSSEGSGSGDRDYSTSSTSASSSSSSTATVAATTSNLAVDGASLPLAKGTYRLSAQFGATGSWSRYHTGMDFSAPTGTPVFAVVDGTVVESSAGGWAGTHVIIKAADGSHTLYAHLSAKTVAPGTKVTAGQQIGKVGETGRAFGAHLHFEYYTPGTRPGDVYSASNPAAFLKELGLTL